MAKHSTTPSRRTLTASSRHAPIAKASRHSSAAGTRRDYLRGVERLKYGQRTLLTQERVSQKFGYYDEHNPDYYGEDCEVDGIADYELREQDFVPDQIQLELPLKSIEELEGDLSRMIRKYRMAIDAMGAQAIMWDDLMEDLEDDDHLANEFAKFQMLRKLCGGQL